MSNADPASGPPEDKQWFIVDEPPSWWAELWESLCALAKSRRFRVALLLLLLGAGAYGARVLQIRHRFAGYRRDGIAAAQSGDSLRAIELLGHYLNRYPQDVDALAMYCRVRLKLADADGRSASDTIQALRRLLALAPERLAERRDLMRLLASTGASGAAADEADRLLVHLPHDVEALGVRTRSLLARRQLDRAIEADDKWQAASGFDLSVELEILSLLHETGTPEAKIVRRCDALLTGHETDPRYQVLAVRGYFISGNHAPPVQARWVAQAAKRFASEENWAKDGALAATLAAELDDEGRFDESIAVLSRWADVAKLPIAASAAGTRLFVAGRWADAVSAFGAPSASMTPESLAILHICSARADRPEITSAAREALARSDGEAAIAWRAVADWATSPRVARQAQAAQLLEVMRKVPAASAPRTRESAAIWSYFQGEAESALGETELALEAWRRAITLSPAWPDPLVQAVPAAVEAGRWEQALEMADEANRRAPKNLAVASMFAQTWAMALDRGTAAAEKSPLAASRSPQRLMELIDGILKEAPNQEPLVCVRIQLLARQAGGREQAKAAIDAALEKSPPLSSATLLHIATISAAAGLDREEACLAADERSHGVTPRLVLAQALRSVRTGDRAGARAALDAALARHATTAPAARIDAVEWEIARAAYLDETNDPDAHPVIAALADAHPDSLAAQRAALHSRIAAGDSSLILRVTDRMRRLSGEQGLEWQTARAGALLAGAAPAPAALSEARTLLDSALRMAPQCVDAHALNAAYYEATFDLETAAREWAKTAALAPSVPRIVLAYARLLRERGNVQGAAGVLDPLTSRPPTQDEQRAQLAMLLADCGRLSQGIAILEHRPAVASTTEPADQTSLALAELYHRAGRAKDAELAYQRVAEMKTLSAITFTADRLAAQGKSADAKAQLDSLASLALPPGTASLTAARHLLRFKGAEAALPAFQEACRTAPQNAEAWKGLIACSIEASRPADAIAAADASAAAISNDAALTELHAHPELLSAIASQEDLRGLASALVRNPAPEAPVVAAIGAACNNGLSAARATAAIGQLADAYPAILALQRLSFSRDVAIHRIDHAITVADRSAQLFPTLPEPSGWRFAAHASADDWDAARSAAEQWRDRSIFAAPSQRLNAELALAESLLKLRRPADAVASLESYRDRALADPGNHLPWLRMYVMSLHELPDRIDMGKLRDRLRPLLQSSSGREAWINMVGEFPDARDAFAWLTWAAESVPPDDDAVRLALSDAWLALASHQDGRPCLANARAALAPLLARTTPSGRALLCSAIISQQEGDGKAAATLYRQVLSIRGDDGVAAIRPIAANNLANLLIQGDVGSADLDEALDMARQAVAGDADRAAFHDTLATVYSKRRQFGLAVVEWRHAVRLAPAATRYRVRLAQALADDGNVAAARALARAMMNDTAATQPQQESLSDSERRQLSQILQLSDPTPSERKEPLPQ